MQFEVIGHRGACGYAPENTVPSFRLALALGVDSIETDVQLSADGVPVIFHDRTLGRTTNQSGVVEEQTLQCLKRLDAGSWFHVSFSGTRIVTLAECLEIIGARVPLVIELKGSRDVRQLVKQTVAVLAAFPTQPVVFTAFSLAALAEAQRQAKAIPRGWLVPAGQSATAFAQADASGVSLTQICPLAAEATDEWVAEVTRRGMRTRAWGLPNARTDEVVAAARRLQDIGMHGTTADYPDLVRSVSLAKQLLAD